MRGRGFSTATRPHESVVSIVGWALRAPRQVDVPLGRLIVRVLASIVLAIPVIVAAWTSADSAEKWVGRWATEASVCRGDGYDLLIERDQLVLWEQSCQITSWKDAGDTLSLKLRCGNEEAASTREDLTLKLSGGILDRVSGYEYSPSVMMRCP
jgi:hypothetical protein